MSLNTPLALKLKECYIALQSPEEQETLLHHLSELKDIISKFTNDSGSNSNVNDKGGEGEEGEEGEEDSEADGLQKGDQHARMVPAKKTGAITRIQAIISKFHLDPITPTDYITHLTDNQTHHSNSQKEDLALMWVSRGCIIASVENWQAALGEMMTPLPSFLEMRVSSREADEISSSYQRMLRRHRHLEHLAEAHHGHNLMSYIHGQIEYLKFAHDWQAISSRKVKTAFLQTSFFLSTSVIDRYPAPSTEERAALLSRELELEYKQWRRRQERMFTACHRVLYLYQKCGAILFFDPFWDVSNLAIHTSKSFPNIFKEVLTAYEDATDRQEFLQRREDAAESVLSLGFAIGGLATKLYIGEFLEEYPLLA